MLIQLCYLIALTACMVGIHTAWSVFLFRFLQPGLRSGRHVIMSLTRVIVSMLLLHFFEAAVFAVFYFAKSGFSDLSTAMYFSLASYATVGYGDVLLPPSLRLVGAAEGLVGTLLVGWTVALLVKCLQNTRFFQAESD